MPKGFLYLTDISRLNMILEKYRRNSNENDIRKYISYFNSNIPEKFWRINNKTNVNIVYDNDVTVIRGNLKKTTDVIMHKAKNSNMSLLSKILHIDYYELITELYNDFGKIKFSVICENSFAKYDYIVIYNITYGEFFQQHLSGLMYFVNSQYNTKKIIFCLEGVLEDDYEAAYIDLWRFIINNNAVIQDV